MDNGHETDTRWMKAHAGYYIRLHGGRRFTVEFNSETRLWECRRDGIIFDATRTLGEAKTYCVEPLVDLL
jgi:hypothetical protein